MEDVSWPFFLRGKRVDISGRSNIYIYIPGREGGMEELEREEGCF